MTKGVEKAEIPVAFFVFPDKTDLQESWVPAVKEKVKSKEDLALVEKENI